jgi:sulfur-oxidizing protein SoxX
LDEQEMKWLVLALCALASVASATSPEQRVQAYIVTGDTIEKSLTGQAGDAARGAELIQQRHKSLCVLCHSGPFGEPHLQGTLAPDLTGIGARLSAGQLRLRIVDMKRLNPASIMPAYYAVIADSAQTRVAAGWRDKPVLTAAEIEDLVAYLQTLRP